MKGKLIVVEGLDGSGKATQAKLIYDQLQKEGISSKKITFPDYNEPSSSLVKMYLNSEFGDDPNDVNAYAASSFFAVDRYASYKKFWEKDYNSGKIIISDRYVTSNFLYQLPKVKKEDWNQFIEWSCDYEYNKLGLPKPDMIIYLDIPIDVSQSLMSKRYHGHEEKKDLHESNMKYLNLCKDAADYVADKFKFNVINCCSGNQIKSVLEIHNIIMNLVNKVVVNID